MFTRLVPLLQLRRSTAFLLERGDDRLLDDIGLTRASLEAMHLGLTLPQTWPQACARVVAFPAGGALPVPTRA